MEKYAILFSSRTGNTRILADAIRAALLEEDCEFFGETGTEIPEAKTVYLGFWTDKGNADEAALNTLKNLRNKKRIFIRNSRLRRGGCVFSAGAE